MKNLLLLVFIAAGLSSCESEQAKAEKQFYTRLEQLKNEYARSEITISKRKYNESATPQGNLLLYTNANRDNIAGEIWEGEKYKLGSIQIRDYEYSGGSLSRNLMVEVELIEDAEVQHKQNKTGWISIENIREFHTFLSSYMP